LNCYWAIANLAEAAVRIGRRDEARALLEGLECRAALTPSPLFDHVMRHARAVLADDAEAEALFQLALAPEANTGPFQRARVELAYAMWLRRQRRGADARAPLRAARDTFDALGALPWGQAARQELRATGETSRGRTPDVLEQLTPQELQIAQMAASGLSNREIGQTLYLSHRTIGSHLYRIFPKLGVASRAELRDALPDTEPANDVPPPAADRLRRQSPDSTDARGLLFNAVDQQ
jgi:DNA-binding CsgD family transcriptional regulator